MKTIEKVSGTCQACFGSFALRGELMVHHGYERPGYGHIVGDCWGVNQKPYELDVEVTKSWRVQLIDFRIPRIEKDIARTEAATELTIQVTDYTQRLGWGKGYGKKPATFRKGEKVSDELQRNGYYSFEAVQRNKLDDLRTGLKDLQGLVKKLDQRIKAWVFAPEKLIKTARKGLTVHGPGRTEYVPACTMAFSVRRSYTITKDPAKVTCTRCIARAKK